MNKNILVGALLALIAVLLPSCRMNNGDIGLLYGVWAVTDVQVDGKPYDWNAGEYTESFFQFQNNICFISRTGPLHDYQNQVCTWAWVKDDIQIELDFTHYDDANPTPSVGGNMYSPPTWLLLTEPGVYVFDVTWHDDKNMTWTTVNTNGQRLAYRLKKTY